MQVCHIHLAPPIAVYLPLGQTDTATFSTDDQGQLMLSYRYYFEGPPVIERLVFPSMVLENKFRGNYFLYFFRKISENVSLCYRKIISSSNALVKVFPESCYPIHRA